ncbi:SRPBCC family protein [Actinoallomurus sp. NBC_01490]|uniref:SRPBCC family protein n=1 Tax=Actinoallomurus sp. NBC_01490 TaxID=2903557 RepID=UPI002E3785A5|nr:SRPBCC family protein [Actinoallomurus sp. NBC_01490]
MTEGDRIGRESADLAENLPTQRLAKEAKSLLEAFAERVLSSVGDKVSDKVNELSRGLLEKVGDAEGASPGVKAAISGLTALTQGKSPMRAALGAGATGVKEKVKKIFGVGKGKKAKITNIVETIDIGVPLRVAYNQWTQYEDFPSFMKKVESVERPEDEKSNWKAQVFWSHRAWEATTLEQVPDSHIIWRAKGAKGYVDGAVSFSELAPNLTRILLVMEYHPQGLFEHTGNLWRAQGRRARLEFKHFRRHAMVHALLKPDEIEGWRGEIREGEVVKTHEEALDEEERGREEEEERARGEEAPEEEREEEEEEREEEEPGEAAEREEGEEGEEGEEEPEEPEEEPEEEREERPARRPRRRGDEEAEEARPRRPARRRRPAEEFEDEDEERPARSPRRRGPARPREDETE